MGTSKKSSEKNGSNSRVQFQREIGLLEGTSITLGAIIGSDLTFNTIVSYDDKQNANVAFELTGIFISPKGIVAQTGSVGLSLIVWVLSGVFASIGANCYTELGTAFPSSGGDYYYLYEAFGPLPAFLFLWAAMVIFVPCQNAILSLSFAQYVLQPLFPLECGSAVPDVAVRLLAAVAICSLTFLNCYDARGAAKIQNVFSFTKLSALGLIIVAGLITILRGNTSNFSNMFENSTPEPGNIALAFYSGLYAFGGANALNNMVEEVKSPSKTLPRAIYISMGIIILVYVMANAAYFAALSPAEMLSSEAVAVTFGEKALGPFSWLISFFVAISTFGGLAVSTLMSSRILFSGARNGHFPKMLAQLQIKRFTPMASLIFLAIMSLAYLCTSNVYLLLNYSGFMWAIVAVGVSSSVLYLRWTRPDHPRPVRVPLIYPILYLIIQIFLFVLPLYVAPLEAATGGLIVLSGLPVYFLIVKPEKKPLWLENKIESCSVMLQKLFISLPSE